MGNYKQNMESVTFQNAWRHLEFQIHARRVAY